MAGGILSETTHSMGQTLGLQGQLEHPSTWNTGDQLNPFDLNARAVQLQRIAGNMAQKGIISPMLDLSVAKDVGASLLARSIASGAIKDIAIKSLQTSPIKMAGEAIGGATEGILGKVAQPYINATQKVSDAEKNLTSIQSNTEKELALLQKQESDILDGLRMKVNISKQQLKNAQFVGQNPEIEKKLQDDIEKSAQKMAKPFSDATAVIDNEKNKAYKNLFDQSSNSGIRIGDENMSAVTHLEPVLNSAFTGMNTSGKPLVQKLNSLMDNIVQASEKTNGTMTAREYQSMINDKMSPLEKIASRISSGADNISISEANTLRRFLSDTGYAIRRTGNYNNDFATSLINAGQGLENEIDNQIAKHLPQSVIEENNPLNSLKGLNNLHKDFKEVSEQSDLKSMFGKVQTGSDVAGIRTDAIKGLMNLRNISTGMTEQEIQDAIVHDVSHRQNFLRTVSILRRVGANDFADTLMKHAEDVSTAISEKSKYKTAEEMARKQFEESKELLGTELSDSKDYLAQKKIESKDYLAQKKNELEQNVITAKKELDDAQSEMKSNFKMTHLNQMVYSTAGFGLYSLSHFFPTPLRTPMIASAVLFGLGSNRSILAKKALDILNDMKRESAYSKLPLGHKKTIESITNVMQRHFLGL